MERTGGLYDVYGVGVGGVKLKQTFTHFLYRHMAHWQNLKFSSTQFSEIIIRIFSPTLKSIV